MNFQIATKVIKYAKWNVLYVPIPLFTQRLRLKAQMSPAIFRGVCLLFLKFYLITGIKPEGSGGFLCSFGAGERTGLAF